MLLLVTVAAGCGTSDSAGPGACDGAQSASTAPASPGYDISVAGDFRFTEAMALVPAAGGGNAAEIEWKPVYNIANVTGDEVCVHDIGVRFPQSRDAQGRLLALESTGGSRLVEIYTDLNDPQAVADDRPSITRPPPFALDPGVNVLVQFHQYFRLTLDGRPVPLTVDDDASQRLGPLFALPRAANGEYQCVPAYPNIHTTVESNLGRSTLDTTNAIMPVGCYLNIPAN